jgi:uncharacterized membrane protein YsdA (DUF1294 family)
MPSRDGRATSFNPYRRFTLLAVLVILLITFGLLSLYPIWDVAFAWLIGINIVTFLTFAYDKAVAPTGATRVPEVVLLALTALGGSIGAIIARPLFRHKTIKASFQWTFWLCVLLSMVLVAVYYVLVCPECR